MRRHLKAKRILDSVTAAVFMIVLGISILILAISAAQPGRVAFGAHAYFGRFDHQIRLKPIA